MAGTPTNAMNLSAAAGIVNWDGTATMSTTAVTQYFVLVGAGSNTITSITPSTAGYVLTSNGASSNPAFQMQQFVPFNWSDEGTDFTAAAGYGYFITAALTVTLPAVPVQGNTIAFAVDNAAGPVIITANTGQKIRIGKTISALAGTAQSNFQGDTLILVFRAADSTWIASDIAGTWTVT
jgi:hypothetical protein